MNPLLGMMGGQQGGIGNIMQMMQMFRGKDPNAVMQMMSKQNPQFAKFLQENQGKSPEQIAQQYGVDMEQVRQFLK